MSRLLIVAILLVIGFGSAKAFAAASNAPFVYQVQLAGQTSYLMGTFHLGISAYDLPPHVLNKLKSADRFLVEANVRHVELLGRNSQSEPLQRQISEEAWKYVVSRLGSNFSDFEINHMAPWYVIRLLSWLNDGMDIRRMKRMDIEMLDIATAAHVATDFLTPSKKHIELLELFQTHFDLEARAKNPPQDGRLLHEQMIKSYQAGDEEAEEMEVDLLPEAYRHVYLYQRNLGWLDKILPAMKQGKTFVAVGNSHLFGPLGLLNLLKLRGAIIERVVDCDELLTQGK